MPSGVHHTTRRSVLLAAGAPMALTLIPGRWTQCAAANSDPIAILGTKLVAWFDDTDRSRIFSDDAGTVPITEGASVALQKAKNNAGLTRRRVPGGTEPVWSAEAYNRGKAPGIVAGGATSLRSSVLFPLNAAKRASFVVAFQPNIVSGDPGNTWLFNTQDASGNYTVGYNYYFDAAAFDPSIMLLLQSIPAHFGIRLYFEFDATTLRLYLGTGVGQPKLLYTKANAPPPATATFNQAFGYFAKFDTSSPAKLAEQHFLWLNATLTDAERFALDLFLQGSANEGPINLTLDATPDTIGSMAAGSTTLTVADATGYDVGKTVIVNPTAPGGDPRGDQFFMTGPGGIWPSASAPDEAAVLALTSCPGFVKIDNSQAVFPFIRAADTGIVYAGNWDRQNGYSKIPGYAKHDGSNPNSSVGNWDAYVWRAFPLPLVAKIVAKSGNTLTLDAAAVGAVTGGLVAIDNYPALKEALRGGDGLTVHLPAGSFWMSGWCDLKGTKNQWSIIGAVDAQGRPATKLKKPRWLRNWFFNFFQHVWPTVGNIEFYGNHMGKLGAAGPMNAAATHIAMNNVGIGIAFADCKNPLGYNCIAHDIPQGSFIIQGGNTADTGRPHAVGTLPFTTEDGRRLAGLFLNPQVYAHFPHQGYIQWGLGGNALSVRVELRDLYFEAPRLTKTIEFFNTDMSIYTRPVIINGLLSSNTCRHQEINGLDLTWTAGSKVVAGDPDAGPVFQPIASDGYMVNLNPNSSSGYVDGQGSILTIKRVVQEGYIDATGTNSGAINSYKTPGWTIRGTYDPTVPDDGQRYGLIMAPPARNNGSFRVVNVNISAAPGGVAVTGLRTVALQGIPGAAPLDIDINGYNFRDIDITGDQTGGSSIVGTISGTRNPRVRIVRDTQTRHTGIVTVSGNVSNDAYNALGATGTLNPITLAQPEAKVGTPFLTFIRGKREGSTVALSGPGAAGLGVVLSGKGYYITGTPITAGAISVTETLTGCTNSPRTSAGVGQASCGAAGCAPAGSKVVHPGRKQRSTRP